MTLDALRGVAAVLVVGFHLRNMGLAPAKGGYLAVDLFFLLSGLVIARSYDARLSMGMSFGRFAMLRLIRLYPLFAVGLVLALLQRSWQTLMAMPDAFAPAQLAASFALEMFMIPVPMAQQLFPLNAPGWSLFFEILINLFYAAALVKLPMRALGLAVLASAVALVWASVEAGTIENGALWRDVHVGALRAVFAFSAGVLMARLQTRQARSSWLCVVPLAGVILLLCFPPARLAEYRTIYELTVVVGVAPALVWIGAMFNPPAPARKLSETLGDLSYPLYALHYPLIFMCGWTAASFGLNRFVWIPPFLAALLALAWAANRYFDVPVRAWLTAKLVGTARRPQAVVTADALR